MKETIPKCRILSEQGKSLAYAVEHSVLSHA